MPRVPNVGPTGGLVTCVRHGLFALGANRTVATCLNHVGNCVAVYRDVSSRRVRTIIGTTVHRDKQKLITHCNFSHSTRFTCVSGVVNHFAGPCLYSSIAHINHRPLHGLSTNSQLMGPILATHRCNVNAPGLLLNVNTTLRCSGPRSPRDIRVVTVATQLNTTTTMTRVTRLPTNSPLPTLTTRTCTRMRQVVHWSPPTA